ncbi:hypothetical protein Micbo1qcDRAFT_193606 [Microdochium bolleyi]|uniref:Uncharacterized protein n=1 Tax=Microdochium bolleyi TaxID=196109 RepID=A0A136JBC1_9PEZI|nr:hypothetical protein Micbo1qcDRAFT_193606 [Microdochium bolleyi]
MPCANSRQVCSCLLCTQPAPIRSDPTLGNLELSLNSLVIPGSWPSSQRTSSHLRARGRTHTRDNVIEHRSRSHALVAPTRCNRHSGIVWHPCCWDGKRRWWRQYDFAESAAHEATYSLCDCGQLYSDGVFCEDGYASAGLGHSEHDGDDHYRKLDTHAVRNDDDILQDLTDWSWRGGAEEGEPDGERRELYGKQQYDNGDVGRGETNRQDALDAPCEGQVYRYDTDVSDDLTPDGRGKQRRRNDYDRRVTFEVGVGRNHGVIDELQGCCWAVSAIHLWQRRQQSRSSGADRQHRTIDGAGKRAYFHYSPLKSHAPKPLTSTFLAPPSPSKLPANVAISAETSRLQTELLQLSLLHRDAGIVREEWAASAREKLGRRFGEVARENKELAQLERRDAEGHNIAALLRWTEEHAGHESDGRAQALSLEDKIQTLDQVLSGIWALSGGEQYARVTAAFEVWAEHVADILVAQRRGAAEDLLDESDEVLFVSELDAEGWKNECPGLRGPAHRSWDSDGDDDDDDDDDERRQRQIGPVFLPAPTTPAAP